MKVIKEYIILFEKDFKNENIQINYIKKEFNEEPFKIK